MHSSQEQLAEESRECSATTLPYSHGDQEPDAAQSVKCTRKKVEQNNPSNLKRKLVREKHNISSVGKSSIQIKRPLNVLKIKIWIMRFHPVEVFATPFKEITVNIL